MLAIDGNRVPRVFRIEAFSAGESVAQTTVTALDADMPGVYATARQALIDAGFPEPITFTHYAA